MTKNHEPAYINISLLSLEKMKILRRHDETVKLKLETADDLWYLYSIIDKGDICTGDSEYKYKLGTEKTRIVKKKVWVAIRVEKTEFSTGELRILGSVVDGAEEVPRGSHHGLSFAPGSMIAVAKERWLDYHNEKLEEAVRSANLKTLLVLFDREQAVFALLKPNGYEVLHVLHGDVQKKAVDEKKTGSFYKQIVKQLEEYDARYELQRAIAASPAFWKEYLRKELPDELARKVIFATVSSADETAIPELLHRPELEQALAGERAARETDLVEKMMEALAKDKLVYGIKDIDQAVRDGNIRELFVSENEIMKAREADTFTTLETLMRGASDLGSKIHLLATRDAVQRLDGLGGVAAVKRW